MRSLMAINKELDPFKLMGWFIWGCLCLLIGVGIVHVLLSSYVRLQMLLAPPCG